MESMQEALEEDVHEAWKDRDWGRSMDTFESFTIDQWPKKSESELGDQWTRLLIISQEKKKKKKEEEEEGKRSGFMKKTAMSRKREP